MAEGRPASAGVTLVIKSDDGTEQSFPLAEKPVRIGRLTGSDVVLFGAEKGVSRRHAELQFANGRYEIVDLDSQNGTWVNGERVKRAVVSPGAEIAIGLYRLRLEQGRSTSAPSPLAAAPASVPTPGASRAAAAADLPLRPTGMPVAAAPSAGGTPPWIIAAVVVVILGVAAYAAWNVFGGSRTAPPPSAPVPVTSPPSDRSRPPSEPATVAPPTSQDAPSATPVASPVPAVLDTTSAAADAPGGEAATVATTGAASPESKSASSPKEVAANAAYQAGLKLDAAGDWLGALRRFDEARALDPTLPGLDRSARKVADRVRNAGNDAMQQAAADEKQGHLAEAADEYDRAAEWLPAGDPHREQARQRAAQLRRQIK